ncbi:ABC transporter ATPase, partial [Sporosarcina sp. E16_8]|nr:ABC transporter ATPase [Sporosarcina sp. E16_8]
MLKKLTVEDVSVLREPLVSGRQSPNALGGALF